MQQISSMEPFENVAANHHIVFLPKWSLETIKRTILNYDQKRETDNLTHLLDSSSLSF